MVRCSRAPLGVLERGSQPPPHIQLHPASVGDHPHRTEHEVPRQRIEELLDVEIDHPVVLPAPLPACRERVVGRPARPVAIGVRVKPMVRPLLQMPGHHRLRDPVCDRRHAQHADPAAVRLGDLHRLDRGRQVGARAHPVPDLVEVAPKIGLELLEILAVHSRRALVGPDPPPRLPDHRLGNHKRLAFGPWHVASPPPRTRRAPVERIDIP